MNFVEAVKAGTSNADDVTDYIDIWLSADAMCSNCDGAGGHYIRYGSDDSWDSETCGDCGGSGTVYPMPLWEFLGVTEEQLRQYNLDHSTIGSWFI